MNTKKKKQSLSSFSILYILMIIIALLTVFISGAPIDPELVKPGHPASVIGATFSMFTMATYYGFNSAIDICVFILILGGFLAIVTKTGALELGIQRIISKLKGKESILIPILMTLFALGGTSYGMGEETLPFYGLLTGILITAGFDTLVVLGIVLVGSQVGVMASTINPFAIGVAVDAFKSVGVDVNVGILLVIEFLLWILLVGTSIFFVYSYAEKVKKNNKESLLSSEEKNNAASEFINHKFDNMSFTKKHKMIIILFMISFIVMIISLIPWAQFGITIFEGWSSFLTGKPLGEWYFGELATWFLIMSIVIAVVYGMQEREIISTFINGSADMLSVIFIIVVARGISHLLTQTQFDLFLLDRVSKMLVGLPSIIFILCTFLLFLLLAFLVPSTSGLAYLSMPFMGGLAKTSGISPEVIIACFTLASGIINICSPTSGITMGSLQMTKTDFGTWIKFIRKLIFILIIISAISVAIYSSILKAV